MIWGMFLEKGTWMLIALDFFHPSWGMYQVHPSTTVSFKPYAEHHQFQLRFHMVYPKFESKSPSLALPSGKLT